MSSAKRKMPVKLVVVVVLMALLAVFDLLILDILDLVVEVALIVGVLAGNDGVRTFLRALAVFQILWAIIMIVRVAASAHALVLIIGAALGIGIPLFLLWTLNRDDVREWMFRKSFHIDPDTSLPKL